jgi:DNA repair exonuclease SbcCD ATPase subunit
MPSSAVLHALEIEGFRGFRDRVRFELDASAVLLSGPNGTGKTSFFDAIQWLLLGELRRLVPFRARKNSEHIVNTYHVPEPAFVAGTFRRGPEALTAIRRGNWETSTLEVRIENDRAFGTEATDRLRQFLCRGSDVPMEVLLQNAGILQQDVMRHVLEAHPSQRHEYISALLGLGSLEGLHSAAAEAAKDLKQRARSAQAELDNATRTATAQAQRVQAVMDAAVEDAAVEAARGALREELDRLGTVAPVAVQSSDSLTALSAEIRILREFIASTESVQEDLAGLASLPGMEELDGSRVEQEVRLSAIADAIGDASERLRGAENALRSAEKRAAEFDRLAALAVALLTEVCPVCEQPIDPEHVAERLRNRAADASELEVMRNGLAARQQDVERLRQEQDAAEQSLSKIVASIARRRHLEGLRAELDATFLRLKSSSRALVVRLEDVDEVQAVNWPEARATLMSVAGQIEHVQNLERSAGDVATIERLDAELAASRASQARLEARVLEVTTRARDVDKLAKLIAEARAAVTERRFQAIQPLVEDIYSRLDPHPTFKVLEFDHTMYRAKPTSSAVVRDSLEDIDAEPLLVFSSSQANIVALSYFLAVGLAAVQRRLPFVMLDDPLQSMDDVNVLGFADLCRYVRRDRQVFISTHDRRFASLLERKLASRGDDQSTELVEFWGWDRSGPSFTQRTVSAVNREDVPFPLVRSL